MSHEVGIGWDPHKSMTHHAKATMYKMVRESEK